MKQIYKVELIIELDEVTVRDWVDEIYEHCHSFGDNKIISSDTTPLDIESDENKWIKDILGADTPNNLRIAIKTALTAQKNAKGASVWQSYEDELILLRMELEKLEHGTT